MSQGILDLIRMGRLSATSAMVNHPWWPVLAPDLRAYEDRAGIGLHLTLTAGRPIGPMPSLAPRGTLPPLSGALPRLLAGNVPTDELRGEIERQLDAFEAAFGRPPDFVDGHQHVHVLPGVRGELLAALRRRGLQGRLWLRDPADSLPAIARRGVARVKALTLRTLALGFGRAARRAGFETNRGFSGFSAFDPRGSVEREFHRNFLALGPRHLVMCHPGYIDAELRAVDPVVETRSKELMYLSSTRFRDLLDTLDVTLVPGPAEAP